MDERGEIRAKREATARARLLAARFNDPEDLRRMRAFAADLEREADALEQQSETPPASRVTPIHTQVQRGLEPAMTRIPRRRPWAGIRPRGVRPVPSLSMAGTIWQRKPRRDLAWLWRWILIWLASLAASIALAWVIVRYATAQL